MNSCVWWGFWWHLRGSLHVHQLDLSAGKLCRVLSPRQTEILLRRFYLFNVALQLQTQLGFY